MKNNVKLKGRIKFNFMASIYMGCLLLLIDIGIYTLDVRAGLVISVFLACYFLTFGLIYLYAKPIIMNEMISFATQYGQIQRRLLRDLELPHALLDDQGKIIWTNKEFEKLIHKEKGYKKSITTLFSCITKDKLPGRGTEYMTELDLQYEGRDFHVKMKKISLRDMAAKSDILSTESYDGYLIVAYFFDETALKIALREIDDQSLAVGLIYLDNYDEALESVEEVTRSLLIALINRKVNKYIGAVDEIAKKLEKDKYLVIMRKKSVVQLRESKFDILEDVKKQIGFVSQQFS